MILTLVDSKDKAEERNEKLLADVKEILDKLPLAGYAFVCWDEAGKCGTSLRVWAGPIGQTLACAVAHDALLKHVAINQTIDEIQERK